MHTRTPGPYAHAASLILILLACLFLFPPIVLHVMQDYDNTVYGLVVRNMTHGGTLYRDVFDHKLPGWYLLIAGAFRLAGDSPVSINLMYLGFLVAGAWAIYGVAVRSGARAWLAAAWAVLFLLWPDKLDNHLEYFGSMSVHFTNAGAVIASLEAMAVLAVALRGLAPPAAAGLLMAAACLIKPQSALLALVLVLWTLFAGFDANPRTRRLRAGAFTAAFALPCLGVLVWLRVGGIWPHFVEAMRYNAGYVAATPLKGGLAFLSGAIREGPDILLISAGAALALWAARLGRERTHDARLTLVCLWFVCGMIETVAGKRYFIHTRIVLLAPAAVLAAVAWTWLQDAAGRACPDAKRSWIAGALAALVLITGMTRLDIRFRRNLSLWAHSLRGQSFLAEPPIGSFSSTKILAGRWLNARTGRSDAVEVIGPAAPPVLYEASRTPGTRFTFPFPLEGTYGGASASQPRDVTARFWTEWLDGMRRTQPALLGDSWGILGQALAEGSDPLIPDDAIAFVRNGYRRLTRAYGLDIYEKRGFSSGPANPWSTPMACPALTGARDICVIEGKDGLLAWHSSPGGGEIRQASSPDGLTWTARRSAALSPEGDEIALRLPRVLRVGGQFRMWFTAETRAGTVIRNAVSTDGLTWRRDGGMALGAGGASCASVMHDGATGVYRMYYVSGNRSGRRAGYAESHDAEHWIDRGPAMSMERPLPWERGIEDIQVVRADGWHYAFYTAAATPDGPYAVCLARSRAGTDPWERYPLNPVLTPEPATWRDSEVSAPWAVPHDGGWLLFFTGRGYREAAYQVGLARCPRSSFWP